MVTGTDVTPVCDASSVTVSVTVVVPAEANACVGVTPVPVEPSPKFQAYDPSVCPALAVEPDALKKTVCPVAGALGENVNLAVGPEDVDPPGSATVTDVPLDVADKPAASVTVNCTI
jgi:hypothetical protein